jgi:DNA primase
MKSEGLDFPAALKTLADKAGVQLQERTPEQSQREDQLEKMRGLMDETASFFHKKLLNDRAAREARDYAHKRGLSDETIAKFRIGFAPNDWRQALDYLTLLGYEEKEVIEAGVALYNEEKGKVYDRFRNRLIIPICDGRGQVIAFGGRVLDPNDTPKYLNSPQSDLFDKGATLFGLHLARRAIRETETAVIVEGYMDAIQAHQGGFTNVVAQMGTALTEPQLRQLSKYARRLILALDPDAAGMKATMRGVEVARKVLGDSQTFFDPRGIVGLGGKLDIEILIMTLPDGQDPDDLIRDNPQGWQSLIENAQTVVDYVIAAGTSHLTDKSTFIEREQVARDLLPILLATENDLQQHYNIQRLALKLHLDERTLIQWAQQQRPRGGRILLKPQQMQPAVPKTDVSAPSPELRRPGVAIEQSCLGLLLQRPRLWSLVNRKLRELADETPAARSAFGPLAIDDFVQSDYRMIFECLQRAVSQDDQEHLDYLHQHLPYELHQEVEHLLVERMAAYKDWLILPMHTDFEAIRRETERNKTLMGRIDNERPRTILEQKVLELRKLRLMRENMDIQFLQQEAGANAAEEFDRKVSINNLAIRHIDNALRGVGQPSKPGYKGGALRRG